MIENFWTAFKPPNEMPMSVDVEQRPIGRDAAASETTTLRSGWRPHDRLLRRRLLAVATACGRGQKIPNLVDAEQSLRPQQHHADQQQGINDQPVLIEFAEQFRQRRENRSPPASRR